MPIRVRPEAERSQHFIREWRKAKGHTVTTLAEAMGTSPANISRIENGKQAYTQDTLESIARVLDVPAADLIGSGPEVEGDDQVRATVAQTLADRVRQRRSELGLSQAALAEKVGVSQQTIQQIEAGKSDRTGHIVDIATALGVSPEWLQEGESENVPDGHNIGSADIMPEPNNIRALRESKGLTLQALGDLVGTTPVQISRLERGDRRLTVGWMRKIAPALGVEPGDLMSSAQAIPRVGMAQNLPLGQVNVGISHNITIRRTAIEAAERIVAQAGPINAAPRDIVRQIVTEVFGFQVEGEK